MACVSNSSPPLEADPRPPAPSDRCPGRHAIRGFHSSTLALAAPAATVALLTETMGYRLAGTVWPIALATRRPPAAPAPTSTSSPIRRSPAASTAPARSTTSRFACPTTRAEPAAHACFSNELGLHVSPSDRPRLLPVDLLPRTQRRALRNRNRLSRLPDRRARRNARHDALTVATAPRAASRRQDRSRPPLRSKTQDLESMIMSIKPISSVRPRLRTRHRSGRRRRCSCSTARAGRERPAFRLGQKISPGSALLSPRGDVSEHGARRFFARLAEGVFDPAEIDAAHPRACRLHRGRRRSITASGPDAASPPSVFPTARTSPPTLLLLRPETLGRAVLTAPHGRARAQAVAQPRKANAPCLLRHGADPIVPRQSSGPPRV